jgi:hypothetical protein
MPFNLLSPEWCNGNSVGVSSSSGTALTGGANNVKGSYTQITASAPSDVRAIAVSLQETTNSTTHCFVDIAVGASGSEKVIISNLMVEGSTNGSTGTDYLLPVNVPAGTRISARAQNGSAVADGPAVNLTLFDGGFLSEGFAGVDDIGSVTATTFGSLLTASATVNTKGAYTQLVASTAVDYDGFWFRPSAPSSGTAAQQNLLDIAIGGSGSEIVIVPNIQINCVTKPAFPMFFGPLWIPIPAGTRLSARIQSATGSATAGLQLYGIYK